MISILYLASALILGAAISRRLGLKLLAFEAPALAIALGLLLWTWLSFILALILPYSLSLPLTVGLAGGASFLLIRGGRPQLWLPLPGRLPTRLAWGAFTLLATALIGRLMWTHALMPKPDGLYSAHATWADFGLHASLISHFAAATRLPLDFPVAAGEHLTYPFMVDLLSGWLVHGGWSLQYAIFVPGLLLAVAFLQLMLGFGMRLFGSIGGAIAGLTLTLLCGSAVGIFAAAQDFHASDQTLLSFLRNLPHDYTVLATPNAQLGNMVANVLLPQRTFVMGLAVFAAIMLIFTQLRRHPSTKLAVFAGALIGLLPLVHAHTFIVIGALIGSFWIEAIIKNRRAINVWFITGISALIVAAPQILWQTLANDTGGAGGHLALGWVIQPGESLLSFWIHNYGLTLLIIIATTITLIARKSLRPYLAWYLPFVALFIAANIYSLLPFAYDNHKFLHYVYLFTYLFASYGALWLIRGRRLLIVPVLIIAVFLGASGSLAIAREFQHQDQFASRDDIALATWATAATLPSDTFFATDRPNQPLATLAGRSIVAGYRGWLYSNNLPYQPRLDAIQTALNGQASQNNPYGAKYLAVSTYEPGEWTVDRPALAAAYQVVYTNPTWTVYLLPTPE